MHMFFLNVAGNILSLNQFGIHRLSYPTQELIGKSIFNIFHPEERKNLREVLTCSVPNLPQQVDDEFRQLCGDGSLLWVRLSFQNLQQAESRWFYSFVKNSQKVNS